jgi:hypothetical protein
MNRFERHSGACLAACICLAINVSAIAEEATSSPWEQDIALYRAEVFARDASYSAEERASAEALLTKLEQNFAGMSDAEIELTLAEIVATADNGHSLLMPGGWTKRYARLPISFQVFADGIYVIGATPDSEELVGMRLQSIDGHSAESLAAAWSRYQGGQEGWRSQYLPYFLEAPEILVAAGMADEAETLRISLVNDEGEAGEFVLPALADLPPLEGFDQYIAPSRLLIAASTADAEGLPLYLKDPGQVFRHEQIGELNAAYVQFKANIDFGGGQDIDAFLDSVTGALSRQRPSWIIVDQRFNFGGDLTTTRELMKSLSKYLAPNGRLFVIISGRTFSAGISSVAYARQSAGDRLTIVGEPVGDALEFWAEGDIAELPNSGVAFMYATERHNYMTGCQEDDCHRNIRIDPIRVPSLAPDVRAPLTHADYLDGADPAMAAIRLMIEEDTQ